MLNQPLEVQSERIVRFATLLLPEVVIVSVDCEAMKCDAKTTPAGIASATVNPVMAAFTRFLNIRSSLKSFDLVKQSVDSTPSGDGREYAPNDQTVCQAGRQFVAGGA